MLKPCPLCGVELYRCEMPADKTFRHAHEANGCLNSRVFVRGPVQTMVWNLNQGVAKRRGGYIDVES